MLYEAGLPTINGEKLYPQLYILRIEVLLNCCFISLITKRIKTINQIYTIFVFLNVFAIIWTKILMEEN